MMSYINATVATKHEHDSIIAWLNNSGIEYERLYPIFPGKESNLQFRLPTYLAIALKKEFNL